MKNTAPISTYFITGVQRSGTTLFAFLLSNHPDIHVMPHSVAFRLITCFNHYEKLAVQTAPQDKNELLRSLIKADYKGRLAEFLDYENVAEYIDQQKLIVSSIQLQLAKEGKKIWIDKSPNLQHYLPDLLKLLPNCKIIHIVRDGRAVAHSMSKRTEKNILLSAQEWVEGNTIALEQQRILGKERFKIIRYEDVVEKAEQTLEEVCDFLQIPFHLEMLDLAKNEKTKADNSYVKKTLDASKLYQYQQQLEKKTLEEIELIQAPLLRQFDYSLFNLLSLQNFQPLSKRRRIWLHQKDNVKQLFRSEQIRMEDWQTARVRIPLRKRIYTFLLNLKNGF